MKMPTNLLFPIAIGLLSWATPPTHASPQGPMPQSVVTDGVLQETVQRRTRVIGSLRARSIATLAALEEGVLVELAPRVAERVATNSVVAMTDSRRLLADKKEIEARIDEAEAIVKSKEADLKNRRKDLAANEAAAKQNAVSQRELRNAQTAVDTGVADLGAAKQTVRALEASLARVEVRLKDATVYPPFEAIVTERHAEPGEWVRPGDPLLTLQSIGTIEAWLDIPERFADDLRLLSDATHVELIARPGPRSVQNLRLLPRVDPRARTFALLADLDDEDGRLIPGMSVAAWVPLGDPSEELLVPKDALVRRDLSTYVQRVVSTENGASAALVPVEVRFELTRHVAVAPGHLSSGDRVVVEGNERLMPGSPVIAKPTDRPAPLYPEIDPSDDRDAPAGSKLGGSERGGR